MRVGSPRWAPTDRRRRASSASTSSSSTVSEAMPTRKRGAGYAPRPGWTRVSSYCDNDGGGGGGGDDDGGAGGVANGGDGDGGPPAADSTGLRSVAPAALPGRRRGAGARRRWGSNRAARRRTGPAARRGWMTARLRPPAAP